MFTINGYEFHEEPERCGDCPAYVNGGSTNTAFTGKCGIFGTNAQRNKVPVPGRCRKIFDNAMDGDKIRINVSNNLGKLKL